MKSKGQKILLTGLPGCGKTTVIVQLTQHIHDESAAGFYTREIRKNGSREGFQWNRLDGQTGTLAHINLKTGYKVGKYGVDVSTFEERVVKYLETAFNQANLFIIDEIGKMECLSAGFVHFVRDLLDSDKTVIATVAGRGSGLISEVKNLPDTTVFTLTHSNRDQLSEQILKIILDREKAQLL